jgi:FKBP-type peptidyl-prolyl cis-trans isomerase
MTSQFSVSGDTLTTADRGFGADGSIVWGAGSDADFAFERAQPHISVTRQSNGVILLDMKTGEGPAIQDGGMLHVQYAGWLADGHMFDTSRQPNRDVFNFPFPPRLIDAWNTGLNGLSTGAVRRVICPSETGYGAQGQPRAEIPGNSTLYFTVEVMLAQQPPEADTDEGEDRGDDEG